jgi:hypothetical protein
MIRNFFVRVLKVLAESTNIIGAMKRSLFKGDAAVSDIKTCMTSGGKPFDEKRAIVESVTGAIEVGSEEIEITLRYAAPSPTIPQNSSYRGNVMGANGNRTFDTEFPTNDRVHKSFIVNLQKVTQLERNCILLDGHQIPIGRTFKEELENALNSK